MPPLWLPKASAKPSYVTRPSSMVSPAAINDPMVAPTSSLKYSPVHWSGDSITPSNDTIRPATISRMTPPLEWLAVADWTCGRRETHRSPRRRTGGLRVRRARLLAFRRARPPVPRHRVATDHAYLNDAW